MYKQITEIINFLRCLVWVNMRCWANKHHYAPWEIRIRISIDFIKCNDWYQAINVIEGLEGENEIPF